MKKETIAIIFSHKEDYVALYESNENPHNPIVESFNWSDLKKRDTVWDYANKKVKDRGAPYFHILYQRNSNVETDWTKPKD